MKVLVLGGAGGMGQVASREAVQYPFVDLVTVADLDGRHARSVAHALGPKAVSLRLDVNDRSAMKTAIASHDVVLNTVGPFYVLGVPVLEQVIEVGRHYADICDDWEPTLTMLALSRRAQENGVTAIIGLGASPGVTNLLALKAAGALDEVDTLVTCWSIEGSDEDLEALESQRPHATGASAAVVHWVQQLTGSIRVLVDGKFEDVKPLASASIHYPGLGPLAVWSVGHPEAVTLPRSVPHLRQCYNAMIGPAEAFEGLRLIASLVDAGAITVRQAADEIVKEMRRKRGLPKRDPRHAAGPSLFAWASGLRNGKKAVAAAGGRRMPPGGMAGATSIPLALSLPLFQQGFGRRFGVFSPEEIIDPDAFINTLALQCAGPIAGDHGLLSLCEEEFTV
ncbi:MAG: saccharopine dehydrogenase NADP-binding domain-containing protein [Alphaproteobacteria bacterium]|nr:saccharopine dehydrogenase NADP-binding domain-containing protein [Alphaproteobacteria bacterium]